jgi:23S rRNA pseudouridine2605 synthase
MPKGDKPQFIGVADPLKAVGTAGGGDMQRRGVPRTNKAVQTSILIPDERVEEEKFVRKPGWAKPKKKPAIAGRAPVAHAKKSIESKMIGPKPLSYRDAAAKRIRDKEMADKNAADKRAAQGKDTRPAKGAGQESSKPKLGALRANGYKPLGDGPAKTGGKPGGARPGGKPSTVKAAGSKTAGSKPGDAGKVWSKPGMAKSAGARPDGPKGAARPSGKPSGARPGGSAPSRGKR